MALTAATRLWPEEGSSGANSYFCEVSVAETQFQSFDDLLVRYFESPADQVMVQAEFERRYLTEGAILVVDFTSMVKRTAKDGIVYALALPRAAERVMTPGLEAHKGEVMKRVADTFFVAFPSAEAALLGLRTGLKMLDAFNVTRTGAIGDGSKNDPIYACAGLGFGRILVNPGEDLYGDEVNRAFVLGEDTAERGEILVTTAFIAALGDACPSDMMPTDPGAERLDHAGFAFRVLASAG